MLAYKDMLNGERMNQSITSLTVNIDSCNDFELNIERQNPLSYTVTYPTDTQINTIVFIIAGFGADADSEYIKNLTTFVAETFSVAVVSVTYHCFYSRPAIGAEIGFDDIDIAVLEDILKQYQVDLNGIELNRDNILNALNQAIIHKKATNQLQRNHKVILPMTLIPPNNEYQNFGIMQALDHLYVLQDLKKRIPNLSKELKTVFFGSSHGGYIANLIAKLAPNQVDYVIDNSTYVQPPLQYIVGKELDIFKPEFIATWSEHLETNCFTQTVWTTNKNSPYFFSNDRYRIRNLMDEEHLQIMSDHSENKTHYISYHSKYDGLVNVEEKIAYCKLLSEKGFPVKLHLIENKDQIDGKFIKNLDHAMGMSIKELIKKELPAILDDSIELKKNSEEKIVYPCDSQEYSITINDDSITCTCQ